METEKEETYSKERWFLNIFFVCVCVCFVLKEIVAQLSSVITFASKVSRFIF